MAACVLWIDSLKARVFKISAAGIKRKIVKLNKIQHHNGHVERNLLNAEEKFFEEVVAAIGEVTERFLIMGPAQAKLNFKKYLERHHYRNLLRPLVTVMTVDDLTDNQILEASRLQFRRYDMFHPV
jgi:stalled ribosome rescue protein Dom34